LKWLEKSNNLTKVKRRSYSINRIITIKKSKNNELRIIPINDILYETLTDFPRYFKSDYVFFNKDGNRLKTIRTGFEKAVKRAGIEDFTFHDTRLPLPVIL